MVQCKRWKGKVGEPVVRDFFGAMQHENAAEGAIITTGTFTPQARQWAKGKPIRLYDGDEFLKVLHKAQGKSGEQEDFTQGPEIRSSSPRPLFCPQCGARMVLRKARQGFYKDQVFYGCSTFPKCRCIVPLDEA